MLHHEQNPVGFKNRPQNRPVGTGKGKSWSRYPDLVKVVGDALTIRAKGSMEAWLIDRTRPFSWEEFERQMDQYLPGIWEWMAKNLAPMSRPKRIKNTWGRVYKMYYSGTSDGRPKDHDPRTRATMSREHWTRKHALDSPLGNLHDQIRRGLISTVSNWKEYL